MRRRAYVVLVAGALALLGCPALGLRGSENPPEKKQVTVWAITASKVYHCPGSRWYAKAKDGKYLTECQAIREGFQPAFGRGCGAECKK